MPEGPDDFPDIARVLKVHADWLDRRIDGARADFSFKTLRAVDLSKARLARAKFVGADLSDCLFVGSLLAESDFFGANLANVDFEEADLTKAILRGTVLHGANLSRAVVREVDFRGGALLTTGAHKPVGLGITDLTGCNFNYSNMVKSQLGGVDLSGTTLVGADLTGANLVGANLRDSDFSEAVLNRADLTGARFTNARLVGAKLLGANLADARIDGADFADADLTGARLGGIDLADARFAGARLNRGTQELRPRLRHLIEQHQKWIASNGADGQRARIEDEDLSYVSFERMNLSGIVMQGCRLRDADFSHAVVMMGKLADCELRGANFASANLEGTNLSGSDLSGANFDQADLRPIEIREASGEPTGRLHRVDLTNAVLVGARLAGVDLSDVRMNGARLSDDGASDSTDGEGRPPAGQARQTTRT
ncbi:MAG: pentapeptide repeat-containing protein [Alphaproteobacteria bacterium]